MCFSLSIISDYKNNNAITYTNELLQNITSNIQDSIMYTDYELSGINNYIKTNTSSTIIEIDASNTIAIANIINIIELIIQIKELQIEYIYHDNNILYCSKKYLNNINKNLHNKSLIIKKLEDNKKEIIYSKLYKTLKLYKLLK
ncbi:hypothetical protein [Chrysochromulina parva virus BQ2]|jgi:hypothetical protein|uniref:Uncharacterized protein n=1 Tax=Chrysochromulina parva virus BQ2 TaxID=3070831 RepID=A0A4Y6GSC8_9VIRU|nr:hypothetical protein QKE47_gp44 [Chrysochromulina parva virus]QDF45935.1 hypothetical protein [Chrysochromulina parva virus BQ2]